MTISDIQREKLAKELSNALNMAFDKGLAAPYELSLSFHTASTLRDLLLEYIAIKEKTRKVM